MHNLVPLCCLFWQQHYGICTIKEHLRKSAKTEFNFETKKIKLLPMIHTIQNTHDNITSCIDIKSSHYREIEIPRFQVVDEHTTLYML